ncbi:heat-shock protein Hsp20 [Methylomonas lenta]|uniref:Heat-shock protein Hsp20 n=1 Tax=Methylomonas lenta TaxID=980561 RepID=A0A177MYX7_9GAMM|nr:Hsp20/alpha crystallin family protein [Methylomonas lenta]OAI10109.1 heat-shock protein Hsp20 [Methylomonas lenta]
MSLDDLDAWMWAEACAMLNRADRLHRQFFRPADLHARPPTWEPLVDIYETRQEFKIMMALPGVAPEHLQVILEGTHLMVSGKRHLPVSPEAEIKRLEIPYGRFERRLELPVGDYELGGRELANGCLILTLKKHTGSHGH